MRSLGQNPTEEQIVQMIEEVDEDGNGEIDFDEFLGMMSKLVQESNEDLELRDAFNMLDEDADGLISVDEVRYVLMQLGEHPTEQEIADIIRTTDADGDGLVSLEDIMRMVSQGWE